MIAVSILIMSLLGFLNIFNAFYNSKQTQAKLDMLLEFSGRKAFDMEDFSIEIDPDGDNGNKKDRGGNRFFDVRPDDNLQVSSVYFTVVVDNYSGEAIVDLNHIKTESESTALEYVSSVILSGSEAGRTGCYRYASEINEQTGTTVFVFLDTTYNMNSVGRVLLLSLIGGALVWAVMLLIVFAMSKQAIRPIKENYDKQRQFITDAGHELKTPLAVILSNTEAMEMINGENKWTRNIRSQTDRLSGLMQNLLTIAKADEGVMKAKAETFSLSDTVRNECMVFEQSAANKNVEITPYIEDGIEYTGEKEQLRRLASILLDNAVKYCAENSTINISLIQSDKKVVLSVSNTCTELPGCDPEKLFDRFYRPDESRSRETGGNGIGLSAAKSITEMHGGKISCTYPAEKLICFTAVL